MKLLTKKLALALLLVSVAVASASPVGAAGRGQSTTTPLARPWYTPQELQALIAYSNASFAQKKVMLAGSTTPSVATNRGLVLPRPRYTPQELKALIAYSKASFAQKKAILAGAEPSSMPTENGFDWVSAGVGAAGGFGLGIVLAGAASTVRRRPPATRRAPEAGAEKGE